MLNGPGAHILVAERDSMVREMLEDFVQRLGYRCTTVSSANSARSVLGSEPVDLLLLSDELDDAHGLQALETVRKLHSRLPTVFLVVGLSEEIVGEERRGGLIVWMRKPFNLAKLEQVIRRLLEPAGERECK